jgi:acyl-CoA synthetase (AMP-forming)/AMP-acid ligase II
MFLQGRLNTGDHVALIYPPGVDLIAAFYGCLYVGVVPVTIRPPHPQNLQTTLPTVRMIVDVSKSAVVLSSQQVIKLLKSKEASNVVDIKVRRNKLFIFPLAEIFFCRSACLSGQTGDSCVAQADSAARAELQEAPKQKLLQLKNIQKYHWFKHMEMLICCFDVFPIM